MIDVGERPLGREFDGTSARIGYVAFCSAGEDEDDVVAAVEAVAPTSYQGFGRGGVSAKEIAINIDSGTAAIWEIEVPYGTATGRLVPPPTNTIIWSGTTLGGTQHITASRETIFAYTDPSVSTLPTDWGTTIGATKDSIEGVDIFVPIYSIKATKYVSVADMATLKPYLFALTDKMNDDSFTADGDTFASGELLFLGATWQMRKGEVSPDDFEVVFEFSATPNTTGVTIGGITGIDKLGWDYLDITYEDRESDGFLHKVPIVATTHRLYLLGDFDSLGLS